MLTVLFAVVALIHCGLLLGTASLRAALPEWLLRALMLGLMTDNLILALSSTGIGTDWYYGLSSLRYAAHAIVLPPLLIAAVLVARRAGLKWTTKPAALGAAVALAVAGIAYGLYTEVLTLNLVPETLYGHTRLVSDHGIPPIATILTNVFLLVIAAGIWRSGGWPWLFAAALVIFIVNGATASSDLGIVAGNLAEILFALGWLLTLRRFPHEAD